MKLNKTGIKMDILQQCLCTQHLFEKPVIFISEKYYLTYLRMLLFTKGFTPFFYIFSNNKYMRKKI